MTVCAHMQDSAFYFCVRAWTHSQDFCFGRHDVISASCQTKEACCFERAQLMCSQLKESVVGLKLQEWMFGSHLKQDGDLCAFLFAPS